MADNVLKLKVDSQEYDSKLKRATTGLQALEQSLRASGKSFTNVDKNTIEYVRGLGRMSTTAQTARGRIGEMSSAFVELSQTERRLTEQERQSPVGQALVQSLQQLRERTIEAKRELQELNDQISHVKMPDVKDGGLFSGMGDKMSGMLQVFGGNMMTKAAAAIQDTVSQSIELARSAEGIENAFARLNRPDLLDNLKEATHGTVSELELMKAAVKFDDFRLPVEELGTMLAFAQQKAKDTGQSVDYMVDSIVTGLGRKSLMILDNLGLSASEIKERMKETGDLTTAVGQIIREQMAKAGDYVETASDRAARAVADQQNALRNLGKNLMPIANVAAQALSVINTVVTESIGFVVKYKEAFGVATTGIVAFTVAANTSTIATKAHTVAVNAAAAATKVFNAVQKASPLGLFVAGLTTATAAVVALSNAQSGASEREQAAQRVRMQQMERERAARERVAQAAQHQANSINSAVSSVEAKYKTLQTEWANLKSESEKNSFIQDNANAFSELGLSINTAADAENYFVKNADKMIKALAAIAKADALKGLLTEAYQKEAMFDPKKDIKRNDYAVSTAEMRMLAPDNIKSVLSHGLKQQEIEAYINKYLQDWINTHPTLKDAGFTTSDFRYKQTAGGIGFHMNVSGIEKIQGPRRENMIQQREKELKDETAEIQKKWEEALLEARKAADEISGFKGGKKITLPQKEAVSKIQDALHDYEQAIKLAKVEMSNGTISESEAKKRIYNAEKRVWEAYGDAYAVVKDTKYKDAQDEVASRMRTLSKEVKKAEEQQKAAQQSARELEQAQKKLADAQREFAAAQQSNSLEGQYAAKKKMGDAQAAIDRLNAGDAPAMSKWVQPLWDSIPVQAKKNVAKMGKTEVPLTATLTTANLEAFINQMKEDIANADLGTSVVKSLESMKDATAISTIMQAALQNGIDTAQFDTSGLMQKLLSGDNIEDSTIKDLLDKVNEKIKKNGGIQLTIDPKTGEVTKKGGKKEDKKEASIHEVLGSLGGGLQNIADGLNQLGIDIPAGLQDVVGGIQAVTNILTGIMSVVTAIQTISTMNLFKLANGGIVPNFATGGIIGRAALGTVIPGNSFSGDNLRLPVNGGRGMIGVNSGEVILNQAQAGIIESALNKTGAQDAVTTPYVSGENIYLGMSNHLKRSGHGEIVTTSMLKRMGLM